MNLSFWAAFKQPQCRQTDELQKSWAAKMHLEGSKDRISEVLQREPYFKYSGITWRSVRSLAFFSKSWLHGTFSMYPNSSNLCYIHLFLWFNNPLWGSFSKSKTTKTHLSSVFARCHLLVRALAARLKASCRRSGSELIRCLGSMGFGRLPPCCFFVFDVMFGRCWKMNMMNYVWY